MIQSIRLAFNRHPFFANVAVTCGLLGAADLTCQVFEKRSKSIPRIDASRLTNMAVMGACYYGPLYHFYYRWLDRRFPGTNPRIVLLKVLFDQTVYNVPSICIFYFCMGKLERKDTRACVADVREKFLTTYLTTWLYWPAVQAVNFTLVPQMFRVSYIGVMSFIWLTVLSTLKHRPQLPYPLQKIDDLAKNLQRKITL